MTEIGELATVNLIDEKNDDKCPFCYKAKHDFDSKKKAPKDKVTSKPNQLKCTTLKVNGKWKHTTAKHHLISALQCYGRIRRLVRMASMVDYDINDPPNGIALPTVANNITYTVNGVGPQKFGKFDDSDKRTIAFKVMDQALAQWHVGHHAFTIEIPDDWADEDDNSTQGHEVSYDTSVIKKLLRIMDKWVKKPICKEDDDQSQKLIKHMNQLSADIKEKLDQFGASKPWDSAPFYVSRLAFDYAVEQESLIDDDDDDPAPPPQKKLKTK